MNSRKRYKLSLALLLAAITALLWPVLIVIAIVMYIVNHRRMKKINSNPGLSLSKEEKEYVLNNLTKENIEDGREN